MRGRDMTTLILQHKRDGHALSQILASGLTLLQLWMDKHHQRKQLKQLEASQLNDLGLNRELVRMEAAKPFWQ
jgi:uncharacterized protein YjiS (DUF1127 family)